MAWATSKPFQGSWAYWFIKVDANLHQFTLPEGGCTKIKLMQKAPSSGILHQCIRITIKISKFAIKNMKFVVNNMKFAIKNMKFSI